MIYNRMNLPVLAPDAGKRRLMPDEYTGRCAIESAKEGNSAHPHKTDSIGGQNTLSGGVEADTQDRLHPVESLTASRQCESLPSGSSAPPAQNYFDRAMSDPKRKHDYYPDLGELRDAWINENTSFYGEEHDTESYD